MPARSPLLAAVLTTTLFVTATAAQYPPPPPPPPTPPYAPVPPAAPPYQPPMSQSVAPYPPAQPTATTSNDSTDLEISILYGTSVAYGVGAGIWFDAEAGISDPGLRLIPPLVLGAAAPVGVYFLDHPHLPRGVPSAIATGMMLGAGQGLGIWSFQSTHASDGNEWKFRELSRSMFLGSTLGGAAGAVLGFLQEPSPKTSLLLGSSALWGAGIGTMMGYGATAPRQEFSQANNGASLGGLVGYNLGILGAAAVSTVWVPSYQSFVYMWSGAGIGFAATLPVYLFYLGSDAPAKRGLIVQGVGTTLGIGLGALLSWDDRDDITRANPPPFSPGAFARITGVGPMPMAGGGMGAQLTGLLF